MIRAGDSHTPIGSQSVFESNPTESKAFVRAGEQANQKAGQSVFESTPAAPKAMVRASDAHSGGIQHKSVFESAPRATAADVVHGQDIERPRPNSSSFSEKLQHWEKISTPRATRNTESERANNRGAHDAASK